MWTHAHTHTHTRLINPYTIKSKPRFWNPLCIKWVAFLCLYAFDIFIPFLKAYPRSANGTSIHRKRNINLHLRFKWVDKFFSKSTFFFFGALPTNVHPLHIDGCYLFHSLFTHNYVRFADALETTRKRVQ